MQIWSLTLGALACLCAFQSAAAPIVVRSGAHDGFSRLVLDVPSGTEWVLDNQVASVRITIDEQTDGFDVENVFARIDRRHIENVTSNPGFLDIQFACACRVTAFEQGSEMIVLDVSDERSEIATTEEQDQLSGSTELRSGSTSQPAPPVNLREFSLLRQTQPFIDERLAQTAPNDPISAENANRLQQANDQIVTQFSAAASRGLLRPKVSSVAMPVSLTKPQIDTRIFDSSLPLVSANDTAPTLAGSNLRVTSSADVPETASGTSSITATGLSCAKAAPMMLENWANEGPFSVQIAKHRKALFSEFDRLHRNVAVELAQTYLYFGFGAEARQILLMDTQLTQEHPALLEIADIMEFGHAQRPNHLYNFAECDGDVALWAILSRPSLEGSGQINVNAALRATTALPMHLRTFLAPELSRRLREYGQTDAAAAALRSLERTAEPLSSSASLARASLDISQGNITEGQDRLAQVVSSNVEQSAEALIQFIDSHLDEDAQIDQSVATLVEGYALQMRDDPLGPELRRAHVLALGKSGQFDAAFAALDRVRERDAASMDLTLKSSILALLTQKASDVAFLYHVFEQMSVSLGLIEPDAKEKIANRLVDLGFAREAEVVLSAQDQGVDSKKTNLLRARIALELGRPFEAEALLFGAETPDADRLRAMAKAQTGAFEDAHDLFDALGEEDGSRQTAWLANNWTTLIEDDTPLFSDIARVAQTELPENTELEGMLSRTSAAIAESAAARETIRNLLRNAQGSEPDP